MMQEGFVTVNQVSTRLVCWGGWLNTFNQGRKELVLCIPGNPGVTGYYTSFLETIHLNLDIPVWVLSHAGHELPPGDHKSTSMSKSQVYGLQEQIDHKISFIEKYVPGDASLYLIGHSIGCKLILEALKCNNVRSKVKKCYLLFPTIERMATSPNGKFLTSLILPVVPAIVFLSWIFTLLPKIARRALLHVYFAVRRAKDDAVSATVDLICPSVLKNVFFFAAEEMANVVNLDSDLLMSNSDILFLYYGATDGWAPVEYYWELKKALPQVKSTVCKENYEHAFVLSCSKDVGNMVSDWIKAERTI